ncbi:MAG: capsular polysaccharide biosynthesis protein [Pseudoruegeria sp.]
MYTDDIGHAAGDQDPRRLYIYNGGFLKSTRIRRILNLSGYSVRLGKPGSDDLIGVWGQSPTSPRGEAVASHTGNPILRVEDAFLRSVLPGRDGSDPIGLTLDAKGVHFDGRRPSDLEILLATHPFDDTQLLNRARNGIALMRHYHLSKYNAYDLDTALPDAPYVLIIDQTRGDASLKCCGADKATFKDMLITAMVEHPGNRIVIKTHPETTGGHREGHFGPDEANERVSLITDPVSPWALMEGAVAVYTVSSQLGFEAILAGHRPVVFGQPFYSGWGLTDDRNPVARRNRKLTRAQLFTGAMLLYPVWYDPHRDQLCDFETAAYALISQAREWRDDHAGWTASHMRLWKRHPLQKFFGQFARLRFNDHPSKDTNKSQNTKGRIMVWANKADSTLKAAATATERSLYRVEDGFLRSKGLGAALTPPLSLALDDLGIYYDPSHESRLERLINTSGSLPSVALERAEKLAVSIRAAGLSKYNLESNALPDFPEGHRILVPGQVEDDASIQTGCRGVSTNLGLLQAVREARPDAVILYKPHPDVEAGLRRGAIEPHELDRLADKTLTNTDPIAILDHINEVWTLTSLLGFEALIRDVPVTCLGLPFYAGWGLTTDLSPDAPHPRRGGPVNKAGLIHASLIDYPRYYDPVTQSACPAEVIIDRLAKGTLPKPGIFNRTLSKIQGLLASADPFWR